MRSTEIEGGDAFAAQLRRLRERVGYSQEQLAERAGLTGQAVGALERGERQRPYPATVRRLADALGLSVEAHAALMAAVPRRDHLQESTRTDPPGSEGKREPRLLDAPTLPSPLTALVGREADLTAITSLLCGGTRLLTLTGPGGVGKTRLAIQVAGEAAARFTDGVTFVPLAPLSDGIFVLPTLARSLGLRDTGNQTLVEMLKVAVGSRRVLLVLDNFEHVLSAGPEVASLLEACPGLVVMATSRAPLRLRGEWEYAVLPLGLPDLSHVPTVEEVAGSPAVQLFVARAQAASPDFTLTATNSAAVAAICRRLDGLPLALELAASRVKLLPPVALLARLDRGLPLLAGGAQDLPARQRTMRDTIAWSYNLLAEDEKAVFRRLSVFAAGCTIEAAEAVCDDSDGGIDVLATLSSLLDKSLLRREGDDQQPRLLLLEMEREYGLERLDDNGEERGARGRHSAYYQRLVVEADMQLRGPGQKAALARLDGDVNNIRTALQALLDTDAEAAVGMCWALLRYWWMRGAFGSARRFVARLLPHVAALAPVLRGQLYMLDLMLGDRLHDPPQAGLVLDQAITLFEEAHDHKSLAYAVQIRAFMSVSAGLLDDADARITRSIDLSRAAGDVWTSAMGLNMRARLAMNRGDYSRAEQAVSEACAIFEGMECTGDLSMSLMARAQLAEVQGDYRLAAEHLHRSLSFAVEVDDRSRGMNAAELAAGCAVVTGQPARAVRLLVAAETRRRNMGGIASAWTGAVIPGEIALRERHAALARAALGDDEYVSARARGEVMDMDDVIVDAFEAISHMEPLSAP